MEAERPTPPAAGSSSWQLLARIALATAVISVGVWILFDFLPALAWAAVLAIALWPSYRSLLRLLPKRSDRGLGPLLAAMLIAVVIIAPLVLLRIGLCRESDFVIGFVAEARHH